MDKTGGNGTPSQPPLPPPRAPGKPPRGAARGVSPSWREDACLPASPGSAGLLSQWDAEEEEDGEGEYELPPCESLAAHTAPFPVEKSELYLDRSVTAGPPKPEPRPSRDPAEEEDSEDAIYLEPSLVSPLKQDLGPQAPSTPAVIPRPTMVPRPAYKALSGPQEAWSGSGDIAYNELRSSLLMCLLLWPQPHRVIFFQWGGVHSRGNPLQRRDAKKKNEIIAVNQLIARGQWDPLCCVCAQKAGLLTQPWYSAHCDRQTVENTLLLLRKDGSYTIRLSSDPQGLKPFTLAVFSHGHVYHIPIRWLEAQGQYALGRESRSSDKLFPTVASLVQHFSQHPLLLVNRCGGDRQHARLLFPTKA
ncbi:SH2 domain-containing protein 6 isoform X1 [Sarcophilus harrisii]|uniref:SH2 domain-containing protein 6 isoform X1 n=1 Tax=Sarcophilus harrisii TaxID=9305 RepID=UPI001301F8CC|nr:SH2 domain-containing protein 6 isoform X1 [Sarcophilus harrisii]